MDNIVYYKFRYTFEGQDENHTWDESDKRDHQYTTNWFVEKLTEYSVGKKMTTGIEYLDKTGQPTWAHVHIHFISKSKKDTIVKQLKRKWKDDYDEDLKGNKRYCLSIETYVNEEKFWRYPLKQSLLLSWTDPYKKIHERQFGFSEEELNLMYEKAHDCYLISQEVNLAKNDKKEENDSLYDRLLEYYQKNPKKEEVEILALIFEFYQEEKRSININTCKGYVNNIMLDVKLLTPLELAKKVMR